MSFESGNYGNEEKRNDAIDFLIDSFQEVKERRNTETGEIERVLEINPEIAWYQAHSISMPFGEYARKLKRFENLAKRCHSMMSPDAADEMVRDIMLKVDEFKRSIDGLSSQTYRDKNNTQSSVFQILANKRQEKIYTIHGDAKKSFMDGLLGKEARQEQEEQ